MMMNPMILFRGRYSHAIQADVHYIPLEGDFSNAQAILARLGDFEYLQGFADRAYQRLIQSNDYSYSSLARLIEDTIEQQYPLWIDANWVTYRSQFAQPWSSAERTTDSDAQWSALGERPTAVPLELRGFSEGRAEAPLVAWGIARRAWRLIPTAHRHRLIGLVQRIVVDGDGRPLPSSISLVRPLWRLLPRRIRRRVISTFL
jgi:hypothetical protein